MQPADIDEAVWPGEDPTQYVSRLARRKAEAVEGAVVIAADTIVELDGQLLGKPDGAIHAAAMIKRLSGTTHNVHTGVCVRVGDDRRVAVATTEVTFRTIGRDEIATYVLTPEPYDKAGGYAIQGAAGAFVTKIDGSDSNVVGLPLALVVQLAAELGVELFRPR